MIYLMTVRKKNYSKVISNNSSASSYRTIEAIALHFVSTYTMCLEIKTIYRLHFYHLAWGQGKCKIRFQSSVLYLKSIPMSKGYTM